MQANPNGIGVAGDDWWHWALGAGFVTAVGVGIIVGARRGSHGPPKQEQWTPGDATPAEVPGEEADLPPAGEKAKGYPGKRVAPQAASQWVQLQEMPGLVIRSKSKAWGTPAMIHTILSAAARFHEYVPAFGLSETKMRIADISKKGGGALPPHVSHHQGRDVDVTIRSVAEEKLPAVALPLLLRAFLEDDDDNIKAIALSRPRQEQVWWALEANPELDPSGLVKRELQYPLRGGGMKIRNWRGHGNHIHVRTHR